MKVCIHTEVGQRIHQELETAKALLETVKSAVSIYGGARVSTTDVYYQKTVELASALSNCGYAVISGGGPGIMEAANRGAFETNNGLSIGLNIALPCEQKPNPYQHLSIEFRHFAARKVAFCKYSKAFVVMPGGVGTLDELFEVLTLIQTQKMPQIPVILYGAEFWEGLMNWMSGVLLPRGLISKDDIRNRIHVVNSAAEVLELLEKSTA